VKSNINDYRPNDFELARHFIEGLRNTRRATGSQAAYTVETHPPDASAKRGFQECNPAALPDIRASP